MDVRVFSNPRDSERGRNFFHDWYKTTINARYGKMAHMEGRLNRVITDWQKELEV